MRIWVILRIVRGALFSQLCSPWREGQALFETSTKIEEGRHRRRAIGTRRWWRWRLLSVASRAALAVTWTKSGFPDSGEVGLAVRRSRSRRVHIGFSVFCFGNSPVWIRRPLPPQRGGESSKGNRQLDQIDQRSSTDHLMRFLSRLLGFLLFSTGAGKRSRHSVISFVARVLKEFALALRYRYLDCPGPRPRVRIFNGKLINECVGIRTTKAFDELHIFAASTKRILIRKIRRFHDKRVSFPMPARVAFP